MAAVNSFGVSLDPDDLNEMDRYILDFLADHDWATPHLIRLKYIDETGNEVSRQWVSGRLGRLREHGHVDHVHPDAYEFELVSDPRENNR